MNSEWIEVKKDWVYQRKKTFVFKSWNPRYMVLYSKPCPALALYEQRSDSVAPYAPALHLELSTNLRIEAYGKTNQSSHQDSLASMAASRNPEDFNTEIRRGSITSLVSDNRSGKSKKNQEDCAFVITRSGSDNLAPLKLVISLGSVEERDDWIFKMKSLVETLKVSFNSIQSITADEPVIPAETKSSRAASSAHTGLTCLGVTIVKESKISKLQENQPILLSNSKSESDSLLNEIVMNVQQRCKLVENVFPEEFVAKYYQNLKISKKSDSQTDCIRSNLQLYRILAAFNDDVCKYVRIIIDEYHRKVPVNSSALYEFGPIRISLLPGYNQNDETIIEYTNTVNRQELHAVRWINSSAATDVNTMLITCVEYKGFRFSAFIDVPLGAHTISLDLCPSEGNPIMIKEEQLDELNKIGTAMKLALNNHIRLADNRTVTLSLPPNVELHNLSRNIAGFPKGQYILNLSQVAPSWPINPENPLLCGLYRFRPEFLKTYPVSLSAADFNAEKSLTAYKYLVEDHLNVLLEKLESLEQIPIDSLEWTEWLHSQGVNCALMGKLANKTRLPHIREHLMIEMIARTAKRAIQSQLRGSILHFKEVQALKVEEELRAIVLHTLATIVGNTSNDMLGYVIELLEAVKYKFDFKIDLDIFRHLPRAAIFLAIQHHSGLQFVDRVYDFHMEAPFAKEDFLMFVPTIDKGSLSSGTLDTCYNSLRREAGEGNGNITSIEEAITETEALYRLGQQVLPLGESTWQYPTHRAAIARQFTILSRVHSKQRRPMEAAKYLDLARATAPKVHAVRALVELEGMNQRIAAYKTSNNHSQLVYRDLINDLKRSYGKTVTEVEAHLGPHHPLHVCIHQEIAELFTSLSHNYPSILSESLQAHQKALSDSTKALGRIHKWTRAQVLKIGDINKNMGNLDDALNFYQDGLKSAQQCGASVLVLGEICLSISGCQQEKGELDEALVSAKRARTLLEGNSSSSANQTATEYTNNRSETVVNHFSSLNETLERAYTVIADLAQKIYEDVKEESTTVLSEDIQLHLNIAVECYEKLFDGIRQKPEIDGSKLLAVLKRIISLKLRLARPSQKILLSAIKSRKINATQSFVSECMMRIVASPSASVYMDRNLDKLERPNIASNLTLGLNSSGEAKELFDEISCLLQIIES